MRPIVLVLSLGLLVFLGHEAVTLHKLTVCRQDAWRSSVHLHTNALLSKSSAQGSHVLAACRILISRDRRRVSWRRLPVSRPHRVILNLRGSL